MSGTWSRRRATHHCDADAAADHTQGSATANDAAQLNNFDGAYVGTPPAGGLEINSDTHEGTFVTQTVEQNENIVIKIVADAAWTGYISALSISWG